MEGLQSFVTFGSEVRRKHRNIQVDVTLKYSIRRTVVLSPFLLYAVLCSEVIMRIVLLSSA